MSTQVRKANTGFDLTDKTAVIAGGSQGIGAGVAIRFAQAGANIIVIGRSQERLERLSLTPAKSPNLPANKSIMCQSI
jgi:NAD(P)-dependent dehydrogenase (short-subunit alcohol dehydrogenase family)